MRRVAVWMWVVAGGMALGACSQSPKAAKPGSIPGNPSSAGDTDSSAGTVDAAHAHAEALREAMASQGDPQVAAGPRVMWIEEGARERKATAIDEGNSLVKKESPAAPQEPLPQPKAPKPPTLNDAYAIVLDHLRGNDQLTPLARAAAAVTFTAALPAERFDDAAMLHGLRGYERDAIERYRHVINALHGRVQAGSELDRATLVAELEALYEHAPIRIRTVKLCQRVRGFGVYDEIDAATLLAGREHKMIAYVELGEYRALPGAGPDGQYEVKLSQEVELYNEADGLAVWRLDPVQIIDHCRNRRRDFFVVQLIKLPPRLNVGKYVLKIRVTDQHGGSVDETTLPIAVVADAAMVSGK